MECPICSGQYTKEELAELASPELDSQLCQEHLQEQLKPLRDREEAT